MNIDPKQAWSIEKNIQRGIERLSLFQTSDGGMSYWRGRGNSNNWGSIYAFHFLIEAKEKGHYIPNSMLESLANYINSQSSSYNEDRRPYYNRGIAQAYRIYTLAKHGQPNIGAMNRLRQDDKLSTTTRHLLAAAYALIGQKEVANELISKISIEVAPYRETGYSYGSELRDYGIILEAKMAIGNSSKNLSLAKLISSDLASSRWYSTQSTAFALMSLAKYIAGESKGQLTYKYSYKGKSENISTDKTIANSILESNESGKNIVLTNTSEGNLYARVLISGQQAPGTEDKAKAKHIAMKTYYLDMEDNLIDIEKLKQGTDFKVVTTVTNLGTRGKNIEELVLNQIFPSGWEIQNQRLSGVEGLNPDSNYDYRDIRDDRVNTFFDMKGTAVHTYTTYLTATFAGKFYLPTTLVEAMYDNEIQAKTKGQWVEVTR